MCKLDIFADEIEARQTVTARYAGALAAACSRRLFRTMPYLCGRSTPFEFPTAGATSSRRSSRRPACRRRSITPSRCTRRPPIAISPAGSLAVSQRPSEEVLCQTRETSNSAVCCRDFEQVVPEVIIDRFGPKPLLIEHARGLFPPL
jgi:hypothetical protein